MAATTFCKTQYLIIQAWMKIFKNKKKRFEIYFSDDFEDFQGLFCKDTGLSWSYPENKPQWNVYRYRWKKWQMMIKKYVLF